jgi:predicted DNA-binding ribbon-helix-helix protein
MELTYEILRENLKKGKRRGTWRKITRLEKALYRAAMAYIRPRNRRATVNGLIAEIESRREVTNRLVVAKLMALVERLQETKGMRIFQRGFKKAAVMLENGEERVFAWAPQLKEWLKNPDYIFWLGTVRY